MNERDLLFLRESKLCDYKNSIIISKASEITAGADSKQEIARAIFCYVRDNILFNATMNIFRKASKTINQRTVDYCNKVNVHLALLKAKGIPARLHYIMVKKVRWKGIIPKMIYKHLPDPIGHYYCECCINSRWTACEAIYDEAFCQGMIKTGITTKNQLPTIDWDGKTDLVLFSELIAEDICIYENLDDVNENEIKKYSYPPVWICRIFDWAVRASSQRRTNKVRKTNNI